MLVTIEGKVTFLDTADQKICKLVHDISIGLKQLW